MRKMKKFLALALSFAMAVSGLNMAAVIPVSAEEAATKAATLEATATASSDYTASWEKLDGPKSDWEPTVSAAGTGKGWSNWSQKAGSEHYYQYTWDTAITADTFDIFWYDDGGGTRIPATLKFMYLDEADEWQEATLLTAYEDSIALDQYNTIKIEPVTTTAIKMVVTVHKNGAANGILRWKVRKEPEKLVVDKTALTAAITEADTLVEAEYTAETWKAFADALTAAKAVADDEAATQETVDAAVATLAAAKEALAPVKSGDSTKPETPADVKVSAVTIENPFAANKLQLAKGKKVQLTAAVAPADATLKDVEWSTSNNRVVTVDATGLVKAVKPGKAKITATAKDGSGKKATISVQVKKGAVKKVAIKGKKTVTVKAKKATKINYKVTVKNGFKNVILTSNKPEITKIKGNKVTIAKGTKKNTKVVITIMATDGSNEKAKVTLKVK